MEEGNYIRGFCKKPGETTLLENCRLGLDGSNKTSRKRMIYVGRGNGFNWLRVRILRAFWEPGDLFLGSIK